MRVKQILEFEPDLVADDSKVGATLSLIPKTVEVRTLPLAAGALGRVHCRSGFMLSAWQVISILKAAAIIADTA